MAQVRAAREEDAEAIAAFQTAMARETEGVELDGETVRAGVEAVFEDPARGAYWVAETGGEVVACLLVTGEWSDWRNATVWWVQSLYVRPEWRRQGIFRALFEHVRALAGQRDDVAGVRLYVATENHAAQRAYQVLGMEGGRYRMYEWMK
ncbi:MAG: GNAT family N-acetyltransferase [Candidatus Brocadiia bacterium]